MDHSSRDNVDGWNITAFGRAQRIITMRGIVARCRIWFIQAGRFLPSPIHVWSKRAAFQLLLLCTSPSFLIIHSVGTGSILLSSHAVMIQLVNATRRGAPAAIKRLFLGTLPNGVSGFHVWGFRKQSIQDGTASTSRSGLGCFWRQGARLFKLLLGPLHHLFLGCKMRHGPLVHANVPWRGSRFSKW